MFQHDLLKGKRILVTGGGSGLGRSMTARIVELGAKAVICGRRREVLEEAAREIGEDQVAVHPCDLRDPEAVEAMVAAIFAGGPLDGLVNNAAGNILSPTEALSHRAVDAVLGSVLHGTAYVTLACGKRWLEAKSRASVVSIVTTYAATGSAYVVPSAMAKAGVVAMTRSLAVEWGGRGVRFNAVAPGPFPTEGAWSRLLPTEALAQEFETRNPLGRPGDHRELADLVSFLLADGSAFINGDVITIDGGEWLKGAGQFSALGDRLTDADWTAFRDRNRPKR
jgi:NAD(P)-dependent dehydrogenase (short-subunit alcohol dehydrogenase family)